MDNDIRIIIINEQGNIVTIFSSENYKADNVIELPLDKYEENIDKYYETIKNKTYKADDFGDKHLIYLKDYLKNHYVNEFENIKIDPSKLMDDILLYFLLSEFNNVVLVNSSEHINIGVIPNVGITKEQIEALNKISNKFSDKINWSFADNMHFDIVESDGKKYKMLNVGDTKDGKLKNIIKNYDEENRKALN